MSQCQHSSYLLSSNLLAFCLIRFKSHMATDRPDNKVPPVARPEAIAVVWEARSVETWLKSLIKT